MGNLSSNEGGVDGPDGLTKDMYRAVTRGDLSKVQELYKAPTDVLALDSHHKNSILYAVESGHLDVLQHLLEVAGDIDIADYSDGTALFFACVSGEIEMIEWLLKKGANPNIEFRHNFRIAPIYAAYELEDRRKKLRAIQLLLEHGADPSKNAVTVRCFDKGDTEIAKLFIDNKVDLHKETFIPVLAVKDIVDETRSPLYIAIRARNRDFIHFLIENGIDFKDQQKLGFDCFGLACNSNDEEYVLFIWEAVFNKQLPEDFKRANVHFAASHCWTPILVMLLEEMGCSLEARNAYEETPLLSATAYGKIENAEYLIGKGADLSVTRFDGKTALHLYCQNIRRKWPVLELILAGSRDAINATDSKMRTPLHYAAMKGSNEVIKFLIKSGADRNATDIHNATPLHYLSAVNDLEWDAEVFEHLFTDLESLDGKQRTPLHYAAQNGSLRCVEVLVERGANIHALSDDKGTPLHHALAGYHWLNAKKLIELGTDVNARNKEGRTPVHYGIWYSEMLKTLVAKVADLNAADNDGVTALHRACTIDKEDPGYRGDGQDRDYFHVVEYLVEQGADVNVTDKKGRTPLLIACERADFPKILKLVEHGANPNPVDNEGRNKLHYGVSYGYWSFVEYKYEDSLNVPDKNGRRPMFYACDEKTLNSLLGRTKDIAPDEFHGYFPRTICPELPALKILLQRGVPVSAADEDGNTLLHKYASKGLNTEVRYLLEQGAEVNANNNALWTPLHYAVSSEHLETMKVLVGHGADVGALNNENKTPFDCAREKEVRRAEMVDYLASKLKAN